MERCLRLQRLAIERVELVAQCCTVPGALRDQGLGAIRPHPPLPLAYDFTPVVNRPSRGGQSTWACRPARLSSDACARRHLRAMYRTWYTMRWDSLAYSALAVPC